MRDFTETLADLRRRVDDAHAYLQIDAARARLAQLEQEASRPDLWEDQDQARKVTTELARLRDDLGIFGGLDERDAICEVHSGAGGTDAQDWTEMLLRMYSRWAERRGFDVELDEVQEGTEAGITSATFIVKGRYAFGLLQGEKGVHRLIRISPFDANARRQTAFASFDAVPALEHSEEPDIDPNDLRIDTYRSSGAGGQHVNVTDSAVRIPHLPTGVVVSVQNERSQIQNRAKALQILAARLAERQRVERQRELESLSGEKKDVAFGSQIRSYTLAPYQLVKDERTRFETGNVQSVLDGELDPFIKAYAQWRRP